MGNMLANFHMREMILLFNAMMYVWGKSKRSFVVLSA